MPHFDSPSERRSYAAEIFTVVGPSYDRVTRALSFFRDGAWKKFLVARLGNLSGCCVADIACGPGDIGLLIRAAHGDAQVVGADYSLEMLRPGMPAMRRAGMDATRQDMMRLAFKTGSVDLLTGGYALRNAPDLGLFLDETARVLKPGGRAAFLEFSRSPHPLMGAVAYGLLWVWGSLVGLAFHGRPEIYAYLARSLQHFPDRDTLAAMICARGFTIVERHRRMFGMMEIVIVQKPLVLNTP